MTNLLFDDNPTLEYLRKRCWRQHPDFSGLVNRDGGEYMSLAAAVRIENDEQRQRDALRNLRATSSDETEVKREIEARRAHEIARKGSNRVVQVQYPRGGLRGVPDPK